MQPTQLLYMNDFDVLTCDAHIVSTQRVENNKLDIVLDQTCFYPRGGGQDWDMGTMKHTYYEFTVEEVRLDDTGVVHHIGVYTGDEPMIGDEVQCSVDTARRTINTRLHSAGHVLDMAVSILGLDWIAGKGQHYPDLSAIEYTGDWDATKVDHLKATIEAKANEIIAADYNNKLLFMSVDEMHTVCRHVPANLPKNKPGRVVMYGDDFGIPCGGTHVKQLGQVGCVLVSKLKEKGGVIRLSYRVEGSL